MADIKTKNTSIKGLPIWWKRLALLWVLILLLGVGSLTERLVSSVSNQRLADLIDTDLLAILPQYQDTTLKETLAVIDKQRNRQLLLALSFAETDAQTKSDYSALLAQLSQQLSNSGLFMLPDTKAGIRQSIALSKALWDYRQQLLSRDDAVLLQHGGEKILAEQAMAQLYGFASPDETLLRDDPLFLFQRYIQSTLPLEAKHFTLHGEWLSTVYQQRRYYLLPLTLKQSAFDTAYQQLVKQTLAQLKTTVSAQQGELSAVGAVIFAEQGFSQSKREISTVGLGGLLGIILLLVFVFRSSIPLLTLLTALALSLAFALSVALWWFGSLHIFALLFSAAIIGISADYGFHFFTDVYLSIDMRQNSACQRIAAVKRIFSGLTLGMLSSVLAYALFAWGGFPVLSQVAVLAVVGLPGMYLTVVLLLPFTPLPAPSKPLPGALRHMAAVLVSNRLSRKTAVFLGHPLGLVVFLALLASVGTAVWSIAPNDDVRALQGLSKQALANEKCLRDLFNRPYVERYSVLVGRQLDDLLAAEARWIKTFANSTANKTAVSDLLPDRQTQQSNHQAYQQLYASAAAKAYARQVNAAVDLSRQDFQPLNVTMIARLPVVKQRFAERLIELSDGRWALLLPMTVDSNNAEQLDNLSNKAINDMADNISIYHINPTADMSAQFGRYRQQLSYWLVIAAGLLIVLGLWRYGRRGIVMALLPVLSALSALMLVAALGADISLFSLLAMLLLLGIGLDYVIFLAESKNPEKVMVSLCLSCVTTILSFGLLAVSQTTAVAAFGMTVAVGMVLIFLLSPIAAHLK